MLWSASRAGLTPSPTCLPGQGGSRKGMRPFGNETVRAIVSPPRETDGGFFMSTEERAAHRDPEFFPENVEFLGFVGGWDCDISVDTVQNLFYLIRTKERDWLEVV